MMACATAPCAPLREISEPEFWRSGYDSRTLMSYRCLLASLEACQAAVKHLHHANQAYEGTIRRQFVPTMRLTLVSP